LEKIERWLQCGCKLKRIKGKYRWQRCPDAIWIYEQYEKTGDWSWQDKYNKHFRDKEKDY
tara:strand:- start:24 stop:203 length:180 start_codon:yes stop_codon:yes gene_type:complete